MLQAVHPSIDERPVRFRLRAFALHLLGSASILTLTLGALYLGWYRWPGWYLSGAPRIAGVLVLLDVVLGPTLTLLVASPKKQPRVLARDIAVIVVVQLCALVYGAGTLWDGRPLYYAFSVDRVQMVRATDVRASEVDLARQKNTRFAPSWYSRPRWVWAPLPADKEDSERIVLATLTGGDDVIQMPRYFKPWEQAAQELRKQLKKIDQLLIFKNDERRKLKGRLQTLGIAPDQPVGLQLEGPARSALGVFDPQTLRIRAILRPD
jgi:hypothetical protein